MVDAVSQEAAKPSNGPLKFGGNPTFGDQANARSW
jgi:hypothetical protein